MTVDLADLDNSTHNVVTGQSGHFMSPQYMDQWPLWYEGRSKRQPFSRQAIESQKAHVLVLEPARQ
jgi:penicillin amidase